MFRISLIQFRPLLRCFSSAKPSATPTIADNTASNKPAERVTSLPADSSAKAVPTPPHLLQRKKWPVTLNETDLHEAFIKGSGKGGQKVNKTVSCVQLKHIPTGITVETQRFRDLQSNRKEARKLLSMELDDLLNGELSKRNTENREEAEKKKRSLAKAKKRLEAKKAEKENREKGKSDGESDKSEDDK